MAEKRRRDELPEDNNNDGNKVMILEAKNKGLATNLYTYKRQISYLENQLKNFRINNESMYKLLNKLQANILYMENDLRDCLNFLPKDTLPTIIANNLEAIGNGLDGKHVHPSSSSTSTSSSSTLSLSSSSLSQEIIDKQFLQFLFTSHGITNSTGVKEDNTVYNQILPSEDTTTLSSSSSSSSSSSTIDYNMDIPMIVQNAPELFYQHIEFLQKASRAIIQTVINKNTSSSSSSTISKEQLEEIQVRHRTAIHYITALQAELIQRDTNIQTHLARIKELEEETRRTVRTLERIRYDNPEIEEQIRNILATSSFTTTSGPIITSSSASSSESVLNSSTVLISSNTDQVMDTNMNINIPSIAETPRSLTIESIPNTPYQTTTNIQRTNSSTNLPSTDGTSVPSTPSANLLSRTNSVQDTNTMMIDTLSSTTKPSNTIEYDQLRANYDNLSIQYDLNTQRLQTMEELLTNERNTVTTLQQRLHNTIITDNDIRSHSLYIELFQFYQTLKEKYTALENKLHISESKLYAVNEELTLEQSRYQELLQVVGLNDQSTRKAYEEQIEKLNIVNQTLTKERDNIYEQMATNNTKVELYNQLEITFNEQTKALESWKQQYTSIHNQLSNRVQTLLSSSSTPSTDIQVLQQEVTDLRNERDGLIASLESVSSGFEGAGNERDHILTLVTEKDKEMQRAIQNNHKLQSERVLLLADLSTKDTLIQELKQVQETANTALTTKDTLITEYRQRVSNTETKLTELEKQLIHENKSTDQKLIHDYHKQITSMKEKYDIVSKDIQEYIEKDKVSRQTIQELQLKFDETSKKLTKLEEKYTKLKEKEKEARIDNTTTTSATPLGRSVSNVSLSSNFMGGNTSDNLSTLDIAELNVLRNMVHCTVCKIRHRNCTLLRCHHTFCKNCIDERVKLRQRKCPSCNTVFAEADIQTIYLA